MAPRAATKGNSLATRRFLAYWRHFVYVTSEYSLREGGNGTGIATIIIVYVMRCQREYYNILVGISLRFHIDFLVIIIVQFYVIEYFICLQAASDGVQCCLSIYESISMNRGISKCDISLDTFSFLESHEPVLQIPALAQLGRDSFMRLT